MSRTILVTGGSGFIGSAVVDKLLDNGDHPIIFDHSARGKRRKIKDGSSLFLGDISSEKDIFEAVAHADGFIHLAGVLGTQETIANPRPAVMTNIVGGLNILEAADRYDVPGVNIAVGNFWENNAYSISKNSVERFVDMYNRYRGTNVAVVRALNAYGPGQSVAAPYGNSKVRKIVPSFISRAVHGDVIEVYGDGNQVMDMIYVTDVADALVRALDYVSVNGAEGNFKEVVEFEAGTGVPTTVNDVVNAIASHFKDVNIKHLPMRPGETAARPVLADPSTLDVLYADGFNPISLEDGIASTVAYYRDIYGK